jgi:hypothetical protein
MNNMTKKNTPTSKIPPNASANPPMISVNIAFSTITLDYHNIK